jgi:hypothetical protein
MVAGDEKAHHRVFARHWLQTTLVIWPIDCIQQLMVSIVSEVVVCCPCRWINCRLQSMWYSLRERHLRRYRNNWRQSEACRRMSLKPLSWVVTLNLGIINWTLVAAMEHGLRRAGIAGCVLRFRDLPGKFVVKQVVTWHASEHRQAQNQTCNVQSSSSIFLTEFQTKCRIIRM